MAGIPAVSTAQTNDSISKGQLELSFYTTYMYSSLELNYSSPQEAWYSSYGLIYVTGPYGETKSLDGWKKSLTGFNWYQRFGLGYQINRSLYRSTATEIAAYASSKVIASSLYSDGAVPIGAIRDSVSGQDYTVAAFIPVESEWNLSLHIGLGLRIQQAISSDLSLSAQVGVVSNSIRTRLESFSSGSQLNINWNVAGFRMTNKFGVIYHF